MSGIALFHLQLLLVAGAEAIAIQSLLLIATHDRRIQRLHVRCNTSLADGVMVRSEASSRILSDISAARPEIIVELVLFTVGRIRVTLSLPVIVHHKVVVIVMHRSRPIFAAHLVVVCVFLGLDVIAQHEASNPEADTTELDDISYAGVHLVVPLGVELVLIVAHNVPGHLQVMLVAVVLN